MVEERRIGDGTSVGESRSKGGESCTGLLIKKDWGVMSGWDVHVVVMDVSGHMWQVAACGVGLWVLRE